MHAELAYHIHTIQTNDKDTIIVITHPSGALKH